MKYVLSKGELLVLRSSGGIEAVTVAEGRVWLTKSGDPRDYCLEAGTRLPLEKRCRVIVEAIEPAALVLAVRERAPLVLTVGRESLAGS